MNVDSHLYRNSKPDCANESDGECSNYSDKYDSNFSTSCKENFDPEGDKEVSNKRRKNNIWAEVLEDQHISTRLGKVAHIDGIKRFVDRGPEGYPISTALHNKFICQKKFIKKAKNTSPKICLTQEEINKFSEQTLCQRRKHVVYRLKKNNGYQKFYNKLKVSPNATNEEAINVISTFLKETNLVLLNKIVSTVGIAKTLEILCETDAIQRMGGLYTMNGERKRTFGGVFIIMVKVDFSISKEMKNEIFGKDELTKPPSEPEISKNLNGNNDDEIMAEDDNASNPSTSGHSSMTVNSVDTCSNPAAVPGNKSGKRKTNHKKRSAPRLPVEIRRDNRFLYANSFISKNVKPNDIKVHKQQSLSNGMQDSGGPNKSIDTMTTN